MTKISDLTTIRVGGEPKAFFEVNSKEELLRVANQVWDTTDNWFVLGGGSNVVASDFLSDLTVIRVNTKGIEQNGNRVMVAAGEDWHQFVMTANAKGWAGIESLAGIPGTVGAAPVQNIGAYGQELSQTMTALEFYDYETREVLALDRGECGFGYRDSEFKRGRRGIITSVEFEFKEADPAELLAKSEEVLAQRRAKGMVLDSNDHDTWSCGSFFTNPFVTPSFARTLPLDMPQWEEGDTVKLSAAWLIEHAGVPKGFSLPNSRAAVSSKHSLAITNRGGATSEEIVELASFIQTQVGNTYGIYLVPEPNLVGF